MKKDSRIIVAGEDTMEGKVIIRLLKERNYSNIINLQQPEPKLTDYGMVEKYFKETRPQYIFFFAGKSGGIKANQEMPATLMLDNLKVISNVISLAHEYKSKKLLYLASSCVYPKHTEQPMHPDMLMTGSLEPTNSAYATAKLTGIELCRAYQSEYGDNFISVIPANIFGPGDDFSPDKSHVIGALLSKMYKAKERKDSIVEVWGSGRPKREFIYVDDLSDACIFIMKHYQKKSPINVGTGTTLSIKELAHSIMGIIDYNGTIKFDTRKPDGMPIKVVDSNELFKMGWSPSTTIHSALEETYHWFKSVKSE